MGVLLDAHRQVMRAPVNPLDKSTIVSVFPLPVKTDNPTLTPGKFSLEPGSLANPTSLIVGSSSWFREVDDTQPLLEVPVSSILVAESIVRDYCIGHLLCDMDGKMPGLFFIPGEFSIQQVKTQHKDRLEVADKKQKNWFKDLVNMADNLWARTNGNPLAIADLMRLAARELGMTDKSWMKNSIQPITLNPCIACGSLINSNIIVCPNCKVVLKPEEFKKLGFSFAN
jgi:hypothetical protein